MSTPPPPPIPSAQYLTVTTPRAPRNGVRMSRKELMNHGREQAAKTIMSHKAMVSLARDHTDEAIKYLVKVMYMPSAGAMVRLRAVELLLAYGWGKPPQALAVTMEQVGAGTGLSALTIQERVKAITDAHLGVPKKAVHLESSAVREVVEVSTGRPGEDAV